MTQVDDLTQRQQQILRFIEQTISEKGYPPTVREIGQAVGLSSPSTVHSHLSTLEKRGFIRKDPDKGRAIEVIHDEFDRNDAPVEPDIIKAPLVGRVTAGAPILATENVEDIVPLPKHLVRYGDEDLFLLRVEGSSMINAGILDGDYVIVRRQQQADNGDIVVALLDNEATVKRFFRESDHIRLQPENDGMSPIRSRNARILGVVVGLLRSFR